MKITIVSGSSRQESQSLKVAHFLKARLELQSCDAGIVDLHALQLPDFDPNDDSPEQIEPVLKTIDESDGFVLISPEWNGMINHRIISFLHYVDKRMADKPVMVVGVSATYHGGHYPVEQIRILGPKNLRYVVIPEHLVIMNVQKVMNTHDLSGEEHDVAIKKRADYALKTLCLYADALVNVRTSGVIDYSTYPNGM